MFNARSIDAVKESRLNDSFFKPHSQYSIKNIHNHIYKNFGMEDDGIDLPKDCFVSDKSFDHVVTILLDGLSLNLLKVALESLDSDIRECLEDNLKISSLSTLFPSSTTSVIPFVMTGYLPEESGIFEWWQYENSSQRIICPFLYSCRNGGEVEDMNGHDVDHNKIYKRSRFYSKLQDNGVEVFLYMDSAYKKAPYNTIATEGANVVGKHRFVQQRVAVVKGIDECKGKRSYHYIYSPDIDSVEHKEGVFDKESAEIVKNFLYELYNLIRDLKSFDSVKLMVFADHGLMDIDEYVFLDKEMDIDRYLERTPLGESTCFCGGPRATVLYIKEDLVEEFVKESSSVLKGKAEVWKCEDLIKSGILDVNKMTDSFKKNFGNVVILGYEGKGIWFYDEDIYRFKAHHGGLSEQELTIPLMVYEG